MDEPRSTSISVGGGDTVREIAVRARAGSPPGIFWLGGFRSDMAGSKAVALDAWAGRNGLACTRFDYSGHGISGGTFLDGTISRWLEEAEAVFAAFASGPQIVVGSSMGGWLALLLGKRLRAGGMAERLAGMVLIAPAVDMTRDLMLDNFDAAARRDLEETGRVERPSEYSGEPDIYTRALIEDGETHLFGPHPIEAGCPVHVIQGMRDADVPWQHATALMERLAFDDAVLTLVRDGDSQAVAARGHRAPGDGGRGHAAARRTQRRAFRASPRRTMSSDTEITDEVRRLARRFADETVRPVAGMLDRDENFPADIYGADGRTGPVRDHGAGGVGRGRAGRDGVRHRDGGTGARLRLDRRPVRAGGADRDAADAARDAGAARPAAAGHPRGPHARRLLPDGGRGRVRPVEPEDDGDAHAGRLVAERHQAVDPQRPRRRFRLRAGAHRSGGRASRAEHLRRRSRGAGRVARQTRAQDGAAGEPGRGRWPSTASRSATMRCSARRGAASTS